GGCSCAQTQRLRARCRSSHARSFVQESEQGDDSVTHVCWETGVLSVSGPPLVSSREGREEEPPMGLPLLSRPSRVPKHRAFPRWDGAFRASDSQGLSQ